MFDPVFLINCAKFPTFNDTHFMLFIRFSAKIFPWLVSAFLFSCWGEKERVVAETSQPKIKLIETTLYAKPAEDPYGFFKKKHRSYEIEIINDSTKRYPVSYERAFNDPVQWQLVVSNEMAAYKRGDEDWTVLPLISPRCATRIQSFDPKGELTLEKYAYYWMACEPILMVQHVSQLKAVEILEQTWTEPFDGYDFSLDPWMEAYKIVSAESKKMITTKMIEIQASLNPQEKENASPDFTRRLKLLKESTH